MNDRNKSPLTHAVTDVVACWMDQRGFKPVETEVSLSTHIAWISDLAGVICPTPTELTRLHLLPRWKPACEPYNEWFARCELARLATRAMTCLVEVKTTRTDFFKDRKWTLTPPTDLAFVAMPKGMLDKEHWPAGWGILACSKNGNVRQLRPAALRQTTVEQQFETVLAIAVRRDHHTRYARIREFRREARLEDAQARTNYRASIIARAVLQIARGEHNSVTEVLDRNRLHNLGSYIIEELQQLWGVAAHATQRIA